MFKKIKSFFKSLFGSKSQPTTPTTLPPGELANSQEWVEANAQFENNHTFYWDGTVEGSPMESEVVLEKPNKKRKPYKKRNKTNNQPKQVDQLGLPTMKANDETPRPKSNKRRGRRPNNAQKGNSASSNPQKG